MDVFERCGISRRSFLTAVPGGAAASAAFAPGLGAASLGLGGLPSLGQSDLALAYWPGSASLAPGRSWTLHDGRPAIAEPEDQPDEERSSEDWAGRPRLGDLVSADSLAGGDPGFLLHGARLEIHGLVTAGREDAVETPPLALEVDYDPAQNRRFSAWSLSRPHGMPSVSGPIAMNVKVEPSAGLSLLFRLGEAQLERRLRLSIAPFGPGPKLRRGVYFAAWDEESRLPDWRSLQLSPELTEEQGATQQAFRLAGRGLDPAPARFAALMLSLDYATAPDLAVTDLLEAVQTVAT